MQTEEQLMALMASGDIDAMDAALEGNESGAENAADLSGDTFENDEQADETTVEMDVDELTEQDEQSKAAKGEEQSTPEADGLISKNGKHYLSIEVLNAQRRENQELKRQLQELEQKQANAAPAEEQEEIATLRDEKQKLLKQMERAGIEPDLIPKNIEITDELMEELGLDDMGDAGRFMKMLAIQNRKLMEQLQESKAPQAKATVTDNAPERVVVTGATGKTVHAPAPVADALKDLPDLVDMLADPELADAVRAMDSFVSQDAKFANASLKDRFSEVLRRMNGGATTAPNQIRAPSSLSDIPAMGSDVAKSAEQHAASLSLSQMEDYMMNQANLDAYF